MPGIVFALEVAQEDPLIFHRDFSINARDWIRKVLISDGCVDGFNHDGPMDRLR